MAKQYTHTGASLDVKDAIFNVALEMLKERGIEKITVREICSRANISIGTFYWYYDSKEDVIRDVYRRDDAYFSEIFAEEVKDLPPLDALERFVSFYGHLNKNTGIEALRVIIDPRNVELVQERPIRQLLLGIILRGQMSGDISVSYSAESLMNYIFDLLHGIAQNWCCSGGAFDIVARTTGVLPFILKGILSPEADWNN